MDLLEVFNVLLSVSISNDTLWTVALVIIILCGLAWLLSWLFGHIPRRGP